MAGTKDQDLREVTNFGQIQQDEKPGTIHDEGGQQKRATDPVLKSALDDLGILKTVRRFWKAVLVCNLMCIAAGADGYQISLNGNIIANQGFINLMGFQNEADVYHLNAQYTALWGAMQSLGQLIGMVLLNPISDLIGRKMTMYTLWVILAGSLIIETLADDWRHWTGAKLLAGIGVGCLQATLPIYVSEWAPANIRGAMVLLYGFWNRIGNFLAPMVLTICADSDPTNYKTPILTQWGFLGIMLPIFLWIPETAAYYADRDEDDRGKDSLRRINGSVEDYDVDSEYAVIKNTILEERQSMEAIGNNAASEITLGAALPACTQQLTGLSFLNTYASLFFRQSGFTDPFLITTILTVIALAVSITLISLTDLFGRRKVVVISAIVCTTAMLVVGVLGFVEKTESLKNFLIFVACVWSFFNVALGSLGWAFVGEVASQRLRARTAGLAAGTSVLFGLTFNTSLPIMLDVDGANWGYKTAWLFLGTGVVCCVGAFFYVPEPSKRNAAELDEMFEKRVPARQMRKYVTEVQMAATGVVTTEKSV
ncbi:general substrate transporter [Cadophora sp. MPI-SDFR-AT-0126]|nr:general substrate transporter [Leotiomycetes sp. MPI-SDFR-AT-0126]